jgi:hypothetical protein
MISMGRLRREVQAPIPGWRKPQSLAGLFFATLLFATSLDAMLLAYRLRLAELEEASAAAAPVAEVRRVVVAPTVLVQPAPAVELTDAQRDVVFIHY